MLDDLAADGWHVTSEAVTTLELGSNFKGAMPGDGWWHQAVLSRLPVVAERRYPLGAVFRDPAGPRVAVGVTVVVGGRELDVVGIHTSSKVWFAGPAVHVRRLRDQLPSIDRACVLAGDFNCWGPPIDRLLPGWQRPVRGRTYPGHRPHSQIDHVLVRGPVEVLGGEVLPETPSDHRPVSVRLRLP